MTNAALTELYKGVKEFLTDERRARWHISGKAPAERQSPNDDAGLVKTMSGGQLISRSEAFNRACGDHVIIHRITDPCSRRIRMCFEGTYCSVCEIASICLCSFFPDWGFLILNHLSEQKDPSTGISGSRLMQNHALASLESLLANARTATRTISSEDDPAFVVGLEHLCACLKEMPGRAGCAMLPWTAAEHFEKERVQIEDAGGDQAVFETHENSYKTQQFPTDKPEHEEIAR